MPQVLKAAKDGQIAVKEFYTAGDLAFLMGVAHATAIRLIDQGEIRGLWLPTKRRQRRITHKVCLRSCGGTRTSGTCSTSSTVTIRASISPWAPSRHRPHARSALPLPGARSTRGRQSGPDPAGGALLSEGSRLPPRARETDRHREVGRRGHPGDQGPRHEIRSHDHLEMARSCTGPGRLRRAEPPLQLRHGPHPGLRVQQ